MYLLGGIDNSTTYMNDVWSSSDGKTWTQITDNETSRGGMESGVMGNRLYLIGGYVDNNTYKDDVLKYGP